MTVEPLAGGPCAEEGPVIVPHTFSWPFSPAKSLPEFGGPETAKSRSRRAGPEASRWFRGTGRRQPSHPGLAYAAPRRGEGHSGRGGAVGDTFPTGGGRGKMIPPGRDGDGTGRTLSAEPACGDLSPRPGPRSRKGEEGSAPPSRCLSGRALHLGWWAACPGPSSPLAALPAAQGVGCVCFSPCTRDARRCPFPEAEFRMRFQCQFPPTIRMGYTNKRYGLHAKDGSRTGSSWRPRG
jgi:hypothetical protein